MFTKLIGDVSTIEKLASDRSTDPSKTISTERQHSEAIKFAGAHSIDVRNVEIGVRSAVISGLSSRPVLKILKICRRFFQARRLSQGICHAPITVVKGCFCE